MWVGRYNGSANGADTATATAVDAQGNVYVTGYAQEQGNGLDYVTLKYNASGVLLWRATYNGPADQDDQASALALDAAGNVYVTGASRGSSSGSDYATIKYNSSGTRLWVARYTGAGLDSSATALAVDGSGNVYVTGTSKSSSGHYGCVTIKYGSSSGNLVWLSRYASPAGIDDEGQSLALDATGNVYVTAKSKGATSDFDYATIKYANNGAQLWASRYNGPGNGSDSPAKVAVDGGGNVYVTGSSKGSTTGLDYATLKYDAGGRQVWVARYNGAANQDDQAASVAVDGFGNVFVTGSSKGGNGYFGYATLKYSPAGAQLWLQRSDSPANFDQIATALVLDSQGNAYVTGGSGVVSTSTSSGGGGGGLLGGLLGGVLGLVGNLLGGVLNILGLGNAPDQSDFVTIKYQNADGAQCWTARYDGPAHGGDAPLALALDNQENVYVAGPSKGNGSDYDFAVVKYFQPQPPVITTQPASQTVPAATKVIFTVVAQGTGPLGYQWRLNGVNLTGETNDTLTLASVRPQDAGSYQVTVANDADAVDSDIATLNVFTPTFLFADNFADRTTVSTLNGLGRGSNVGATRETGEPKHAGKTGGKSVWLTWRAPASGIVTMTTAGSSFDTLLAVYTGTNLNALTMIASDDDSGGFLTSKVTFNAQVGVDYQIAIDGLNGASGDIVLSWVMEITTDRLPVITSMSDGKTVGIGEDATFAVSVDTSPVNFQWYLNGNPVTGAISNNITVTNVQEDDVGLYYVRVMAGTREIYSQPSYLQINRTDNTVDRGAVAVDKLSDLAGLRPAGTLSVKGNGGFSTRSTGTSRGYSGTQIFNTYGGTTQSGEPANCGSPGGASAWFAYQAPESATLYINTDGSSFDTTLGVYVGNGNDFSSLVCVACDNNSGTNGKTSAVRFPATGGVTYYISVDGVNGAHGKVVLSYNLGDPVVILAAPATQYADPGQTLSFAVGTQGTTPMGCQWSLNGVKLAGATNATLSLTNVQSSKAGTYSVSLSNLINVVNSSAPLYFNSPTISISAQPQNQTVSDGADSSFSVSATGSGTLTYQWQFEGVAIGGATNATLILPAVHTNQAGRYSVRISDANGPRLSACATLTVSPLPAILRDPASQTVANGQSLTLNAVAAGCPQLQYQWQRDHTDLPNATNSSLTVSNFQSSDEGNYRVRVMNSFGSVVSADALVMAGSVPRLSSAVRRSDKTFQFQLVGLANKTYLIQASTNLMDWQTLGSATPTNGFLNYIDADAVNWNSRYYRAVLAQ
jgi:hypothetical protein